MIFALEALLLCVARSQRELIIFEFKNACYWPFMPVVTRWLQRYGLPGVISIPKGTQCGQRVPPCEFRVLIPAPLQFASVGCKSRGEKLNS